MAGKKQISSPRLRFAALAMGVLLTSAGYAGAQWTEVGDAGDFPGAGGYQSTTGTGALTTISGATSTGSGDRVDAYCIRITNAATFHATTAVANNPAAVATWDTRLFLFLPNGTYVMGNDDTPSASVLQSLVSDPSTFPSNAAGGTFDNPASLQNGQNYILIITGFSNNLQDSANVNLARMTAGNGWSRLYGLNPLSNGVFHHWINSTTASGTYTIALSGAEFCVDSTLGACCQVDGTCAGGQNELDCIGSGGLFLGAGTNCASVNCGGACCFPDGSCTNQASANACLAAGGLFQGANTTCDVALCPQPNDFCVNAITLSLNTPVTASNLGASDDDAPDCTIVSPNQGVWYRVAGTGNTMTATTCQPSTNFDTMIQVWCTCDLIDCVAGNDDATGALDPACEIDAAPGFNRASRVSWCSTAGHDYLIHVGGFNGALSIGTFELVVTDDGTPCAEPVICTPASGACCTSFVCADDETEADCLSGGGAYQGDDTTCLLNPCPQPPPNDECLTAAAISASGPTGIHTCTASTSIEPAPTCQIDFSRDAWWVHQAPCTGTLTIDTSGSQFAPANDTVLAVYSACGGTELACDDDGGPGQLSSVSIEVVLGQTVYIRVAGAGADACGDVSLNFDCALPCNTCVGDMNSDQVLRGDDVQAFADCCLSFLGTAPGPGCACTDMNDDGVINDLDLTDFVNALINGPFQCVPGRCCYLNGDLPACEITLDSVCDTLNGLWTPDITDCSLDPCPVGRCCSTDGQTCANLTELECGAIAGLFAAGLNCLDDPCPIPPTNDDCGFALVAIDGANAFDLIQAGDSGPSEPACAFPFGDADIHQDTWYVYTATCTGVLFVDTCGAEEDDTRIAVYAGSDCNSLGEPLECNDDHGNVTEGDTGNPCPGPLEASLSIPVAVGDEFIIRVGSFNGGQSGADALNISCQP